MKYRSLLFIVAVLTLAGCRESAQKQSTASADYGYALLYSVTQSQQNVDKLLWVKNPGAEIEAWIKKIAPFNQAVTKQLEAWKESGIVTNLKSLGLPEAENVARKRATDRTTGELLFSEDTDLRVALVVAQLKALDYCSDLCYAIGEETTNPEVKKAVEDWQKQFTGLGSQGMAILEVGMSHAQADASVETDEKPRPPAFHKQ